MGNVTTGGVGEGDDDETEFFEVIFLSEMFVDPFVQLCKICTLWSSRPLVE